MHYRQVHGISEQPAEHTTSGHCSGEDGSRVVSSGTKSEPESGRLRNGTNSANNEPLVSEERTSVEPAKISGRRSGGRRTER